MAKIITTRKDAEEARLLSINSKHPFGGVAGKWATLPDEIA